MAKSTKCYTLLLIGWDYIKSWPKDKRLTPLFPDIRIIKLTKIALQFMPLFTFFSIGWAVLMKGSLAIGITTAIFSLFLPVHGLYWLGLRAKKALPLSLLDWFYTMQQKLEKTGTPFVTENTPPCYLDVAKLVKIIYNQSGGDGFDKL